MKLSLITINFNNQLGLEKTIQSVVSQSYTDYEYIVIDGGSNDDSIDIIKQYEKHINYWISEPDNGVYHAMNKGIQQANGEYLLFLNSGDVLANDRVIEEVLLNGLSADIVSCNAIYESSKYHEKKIIQSPDNIKASDIILSFLPHQATFIKRKLFDEIHPYDETLKIVADWAFFIEALLLRNKTYNHLSLIVAICETEGMSSDPSNNQLMDTEFHAVAKRLLPLFYDDYVKLREVKAFEDSVKYSVLKKFESSKLFRLIWAVRKRLLKYGYYDLKARIKQKKYNNFLAKSDKKKKAFILKEIYKLKSNLLKRSDDKQDIIVSLTSHGSRVKDSLPYALFSIFTQSVLPNRVVLYLDNVNWNDSILPDEIKHYKKLGLEVYYCQDIRSYKKLVPALKQFPYNPIITIDDDIYYANDLIKSLIDEYSKSDKKTVICHWACIQEKREGKFIPYSKWLDSKYGNQFSIYSPFGGDGTLYPPGIFDNEIIKDEVFMKLAPTADDMWFWLMEYRQNIQVKLLDNAKKLVNENVNKLDLLVEKNSTALYFQNCVRGENDVQFQKLLEYYNYK